MSILKVVEEVAGAVAAEKAVEAVDPNAGILEKAAAAVAGYEGVNKINEYLNKDEQAPATAAPAATAEQADPSATDPNAPA